MNELPDNYNSNHILIAGAGPAGLMLGHLLHQRDIPFHIVEKNARSHRHSRAIGIHPISLKIFEEIGVLDLFLEDAFKISKGAAYLEKTFIGSIDFSLLPFKHPFILTLPQYRTERILRDDLLTKQPGCISYSTAVENFKRDKDKVRVRLSDQSLQPPNETAFEVAASFLVGCDGKNSQVRQKTSLQWEGSLYPGTYVMGDFQGRPPNELPANIHLHPDGVVESFALPKNRQRWVAKTDRNGGDLSNIVRDEVHQRVGCNLSGHRCLRSSRFGIERYKAHKFFDGRIILAGDAAHVVSPIGGQGMNLGWIGTQTLADCLESIYRGNSHSSQLKIYDSTQQRRASKAINRAEINMKIGQAYQWKLPRRLLLNLLLNTPLERITARLFTMHGLDRWPV